MNIRGLRIFGSSTVLFGAVVFASFIVLPNSAFAFTGGGSGTALDPYEIYTCNQLLEINDDLSADYELEDDIDCTGVTYDGIGANGSEFTGTLDGRLQTISNITSTSALGVFNWVIGATIENLQLSNNSFDNASFYVGGAVGSANGGTIRNIRAESTNSLTNSGGGAGGIVGYAVGTVDIDRTYFDGTITYGGSYNGGVIGLVNGGATTVDNSYSNATFTGAGSYTGGLVGSRNGGTLAISNSYAAVTFNDVGTYNGGFVGGLFTGSTVTNSFSASDMTTAAGNNSGAMFGYGDGTSTNNFFDQTLADRSNCSGAQAAACTGVNVANADPNYFINNNTNAPLNTWDFDLLWQTNASSYPSFSTFGAVQVDTPDVTSSSINFGYNFAGLQGAGPISSPEIRYRKANTSNQWTYLTNVQTENFDLTINGLEPSTQYEVEIRAAFDGVGEFTDWSEGTFQATTAAALVSETPQTSETTLAPTGKNQTTLIILIGLLLIPTSSLIIKLKHN